MRIMILDYLEQNKVHPSVETIFIALKKKVPTLSKTSIYNSLNIFKEKGLLTPIFITGSEQHFDCNPKPHPHFFCKKCKRIIDMKVKQTYAEDVEVEGHRITEFHGYYLGICKDCLKKGAMNGYCNSL